MSRGVVYSKTQDVIQLTAKNRMEKKRKKSELAALSVLRIANRPANLSFLFEKSHNIIA